jgi:hypothetical protein
MFNENSSFVCWILNLKKKFWLSGGHPDKSSWTVGHCFTCSYCDNCQPLGKEIFTTSGILLSYQVLI